MMRQLRRPARCKAVTPRSLLTCARPLLCLTLVVPGLALAHPAALMKGIPVRTDLFCTYENPQKDYRSAYVEQTELVEFVEALGFDEAWVAEHHFNAAASSSSPLPILAHLATRTSRIRLGSAAVLLPFHDPITVAEDVATVDILSDGSFDFGIAKGGPFPVQNKHFHISPEETRARTWEALTLIQKLLNEDGEVSFHGAYFKADGVELVPRPLQRPVPTFVATSTADTVQLAAEHGYGIMAAPPFPLARVRESVQHYRETAPGADPRLVVIRFLHLAPTRDQAVAEATVFLQPFIERMQITTAKMQPDWTPWMVLEPMIADSLIGTEADVCAKIDLIRQEMNPRSLILKPLSPQFHKRKEDLRTHGEKIRTLVAA
jgi:alkanesulfonate monooxygenase SsuD/methylene tetrahydromethanopterin reductase-like flavin-dependent oxidoreductase (luciferase family)